MIESTTDISLEMNSMEVELKENESICLENCCKLELMKRQNVPKRTFRIVSKLGINYLHNLKASMKYYVLTQYVSEYAIQVSNDCTSIVEKILQFCTIRHF